MTETIWLRGEGGALLTASLPLHFSLQDRLDKGQMQRVNRDGTAWLEPPQDEPERDPEPSEREYSAGEVAASAAAIEREVERREAMDQAATAPPKRTASQAEWAAYAVTQGMNAGEAAGMKRDDLYKAYRQGLRAVS